MPEPKRLESQWIKKKNFIEKAYYSFTCRDRTTARSSLTEELVPWKLNIVIIARWWKCNQR